jgi:thymidylate kinase
MIIQIRGTSGSGKTTLARAVMGLYAHRQEHYVEGRKRPLAYTFTRAEHTRRPLYAVGHYESACGGADTISAGFEFIFDLVTRAHAAGNDVLLEGLLISNDSKRIIEVCHANPEQHLLVCLNTPVEQCLANIRARRAAKGNDKPLSEKNTRDKHAYGLRQNEKLAAAGVNYIVADYDTALTRIKETLKCT